MVDELEAKECYDSIAIGIDLKARDLQEKLKERKLPWLLSKGFKGSAHISNFISRDILGSNIKFEMTLNGESRQIGNSNKMIFSFEKIIYFISQYIKLSEGDIIYTGTPKGVGRLSRNDKINLYIDGHLISEIILK